MEQQVAQDGENAAPFKPQRKITFEDYENFLEKLDKEGKLEAIAFNNPKVNLQNMNAKYDINEDKLKEQYMNEFRQS